MFCRALSIMRFALRCMSVICGRITYANNNQQRCEAAIIDVLSIKHKFYAALNSVLLRRRPKVVLLKLLRFSSSSLFSYYGLNIA